MQIRHVSEFTNIKTTKTTWLKLRQIALDAVPELERLGIQIVFDGHWNCHARTPEITKIAVEAIEQKLLKELLYS